MSKFKVGDKVRYITIPEIEFIITDVSKFDNSIYRLKKINGNTEVYNHEALLELCKTPHQELLDLGWVIDKDDNRYIEYINEEGDYLIIDKIEKTYYNLSSYYRPFDINLQLAKILVRFLEELE